MADLIGFGRDSRRCRWWLGEFGVGVHISQGSYRRRSVGHRRVDARGGETGALQAFTALGVAHVF